MEAKTENDAMDSPADPTVQPKLIRSIVIDNSQIIGGLIRTALLLMMAAMLLGIWIRSGSSASFRATLWTIFISLFTVSAAFMILSQILDRALRRCPVCRTRITGKTEENRHCLECNTELWGYWDE